MANARRLEADERKRVVSEARALIDQNGPQALLTRKQASAMLNRQVRTLHDWAWRKIGPRFVMVGGRPLYRWTDIEAYLTAQTVGTADQPAEGGIGA